MKMMRWRKIARAYVYLIVPLLLVLVHAPRTFISAAPSTGSTKLNKAEMNNTVHTILMKQKFLQTIKDRLDRLPSHNNSNDNSNIQASPSVSPWAGTLTRGPKSLNASDLPATSTEVPTEEFIPKLIEDSRSTIHPILVLKSASTERKLLTFHLQRGAIGNITVHRITLMLYVWRSKKKKMPKEPNSSGSPPSSKRALKQIKKRKRREGRMIKIRVFMSNANNTRGRRIAELKKRVKKSEWQRLFLPVSLARTFGENSGNNNTLHLRVECEQCIGGTRLFTPSERDSDRCKRREDTENDDTKEKKKKKRKRKKRKKRKKKKRRLLIWRKFCAQFRTNISTTRIPFMVMETKNNARSKRALEMGTTAQKLYHSECSSPQELISTFTSESGPVMTDKPNRKQCCTMSTTFVQFKDLGLDDIILSPSGFDYVTCTTACPGSPDTLLPQENKESLNRILKALSHNLRVALTDNGSRASQKTDLGDQGSGPPVYSRQLRKWRDHWHGHNRIRSKTKHNCRPVETQSLVILHFTHDHRLTTSILPNFLITRCGCKEHLP